MKCIVDAHKGSVDVISCQTVGLRATAVKRHGSGKKDDVRFVGTETAPPLAPKSLREF